MSTEARSEPDDPIEPVKWPAPVLRVTLHWGGNSWSTGDAVRVPSMTLPRSEPAESKPTTTGFWVSAQDSEGRVRYRTRMTDPLRGVEMFDETGTLSRLQRASHEIDIEVLLPDRDAVAAIEIVSNATDRSDQIKPYRTRLAIDRTRVRQPGVADPQTDHDHHDTSHDHEHDHDG